MTVPTVAGSLEARKLIVAQHSSSLPEGMEAAAESFPVRGSPAVDLEPIVATMPWMTGAIRQIVPDIELRRRLGRPGFSFRPIVLSGVRADIRHSLFVKMLSKTAEAPWCTVQGVRLGRAGVPTPAVQAVLETGAINPIVFVPDAAVIPRSQIIAFSAMLDRVESARLDDPYLGVEVDASLISWILVAERASDLPSGYLDLCHVVDVREQASHQAIFSELIADSTIDSVVEELGTSRDHLPVGRLRDFLISLPVTSIPDLRKRAIDALASAKEWETDDLASAAVMAGAGAEPYVTICQEISGVGSNGEEFVRTYDMVTRPLPLSGGGVTPEHFQATLTEEFPWLAEAINLITDDLRLVHAGGMRRFQFRPLVVHGPAGIGKSRFARRMADLARVGYRYVSAGGMAGGNEFAGTGRSAEDPHPSTPVLAIYRSQTANPIVFVDEIDKIDHEKRGGTLEDALLAVLEAETAKRYFDECLQAQVDLSFVSYFFAVNDVHSLNPIMKDRMRVVSVKRPPPSAFPVILRGIMDEVSRDYAIPRHLLPTAESFPSADLEFRSGLSIRGIKQIIFTAIPGLLDERRKRDISAQLDVVGAEITDAAALLQPEAAPA
jgi:hypothetical protein